MVIITVLLALACARSAGAFPARVVAVSDGDTLTVLSASRERIRIRLSGIDAPELGQAFGHAAKAYTSHLAYRREVEVRPEGRDQHGRLIARVVVGGRDLARETVAAGYAWHNRRFSGDLGLAAAQASARRARLGLWRDAHPVPPWRFRKYGGKAGTP